MKKPIARPPHVSTSSLRASDVLLDYLKPEGRFLQGRRDELTRILRELGCIDPLGAVVRGTYGVHWRKELASKLESRPRIASNMTATETLLGYLKRDGQFSKKNRNELQRILSEEMGSTVHLGQILRGAYGMEVRVELARRARNSKILNQ